MANIMKINQQAKELVALLDEHEGEFTAEVVAAFDAIAQSGQGAIAILADVKDEIEGRMRARQQKATELSLLAAKDASMIETAKRTMLKVMDALGADKIEVGALVVTKCKGQESLEVFDESLIPDRYVKVTVVVPKTSLELIQTVAGEHFCKEPSFAVDKTAIKADIKNSRDAEANTEIGIAGTRMVRNPYLTIKG